MCGLDSVKIHERRRQLDLPALGRRLAPTVAEVRENGFLLRFRVPPYEMTVFADGRAIIKGTRDTSVARSLYARYIGVSSVGFKPADFGPCKRGSRRLKSLCGNKKIFVG